MNRLLLSTLLLAFGAATSTAHAQAAKAGDAKAGETKAAMCMGCHSIPNYSMSYPEQHKIPKISGQSAAYIVSALTSYRKGDRKHPTMRGIADSLSDQDIADVAAFYSGNAEPHDEVPAKPAKEPSPQVADLLKRGNCISCHGENFNKAIDPSYPKLAGQYADYLFVALKAYQTTNSPVVGRNNAIMAGMVKPFSHAELKQLADYISSLPGDVQTVAQGRFR